MRPHERRPPQDGEQTPRSLAEFLARASVRDRYPHYDLGAAEARLLRTAPHVPVSGHRARRRSVFGWSDPARDCPLDSERARRDLKATCLASVCAPKAEAQLESFLACGHTDLAGAVVFGCLLHLAGLREGARFWWQFAAGSGSARTAQAAYCLFLDHSRRGEHHDARLWARELGRRGFRPGGRRDLREVRLCAQAAVLRYVDQRDDPDLGPVPLPRPGLPAVLAAFRPPKALVATPATAATSPAAAAVPATAAVSGSSVAPSAAVPPLATGPLRHPALTAAARGTVVQAGTGEALAEARRALAVVRVLEQHPLGVRTAQLARTSGLSREELGPLLSMLCEEEYAYRPAAGVYARGPALDRLAAPGGQGLAGQLQRTLALARDSVGAAVYLSRYAEGEVRITQMADGPGTPPVREWVDFRAAAHASAVGKCLLTQLDHDRRADHVARHRPARLTPQTITDSRALFTALDAVAPGAPVFDLLEYSPGVVCSAVPIATGDAAGSLALSLPAAHAHRLPAATAALRRKAVPVLLALLLSGAIPPDAAGTSGDAASTSGSAGDGGPDGTSQSTGAPDGPGASGTSGAEPQGSPFQPGPRRAPLTPETLRHLRRLFRTPLTGTTGSPAGPHLVSDTTSAAAYFFDALPDTGQPCLSLPHTFTQVAPGTLATPTGLVVLGP